MSDRLDNPINWSFSVGRLFRIDIRLHILFVLGALVILAQEFHEGLSWRAAGYAFGQVGLLFFIVLCHEFGHCFGARLSGGEAHEILLWPLGGLALTSPPHTPKANLITVVAGPLVNVVFLFVVSCVLLAWKQTPAALPLNPFKPFATAAPIESEIQHWLVIFFTLNYIILLFNLAPVFPLDGGRVLQCVLWYRRGYRPATRTATFVGMVGAIVIGVIGLFAEEMIFFAIAFFGYFTCWQHRQMLKADMLVGDNEFGYDFSRGYASLDDDELESQPRVSFWQRRRLRKAQAKAEREASRRAEHQRCVDEILDKVHRYGMDSLTPRERRILQEETDRQRTQS